MKNMEIIRHRARNCGGTNEERLHYAAATLDDERKRFTPPKGVTNYAFFYCKSVNRTIERRGGNNNVAVRITAQDDISYGSRPGDVETI